MYICASLTCTVVQYLRLVSSRDLSLKHKNELNKSNGNFGPSLTLRLTSLILSNMAFCYETV